MKQQDSTGVSSGQSAPCPRKNRKSAEKRIYPAVKRSLDIVISAVLLVILSPLFAIITLLVLCSGRGGVFFLQKRVGRDRRLFTIFKFRTMKEDTDGNIPTHLFSDAESYVTPIGRLLRKTSLDELPQLINILLGQMSLIGPRPALWNQDDLVCMRERRGANSIRPGLSGWAQVNGRDEIDMSLKVRYDAEYVRKMSFLFDCKCMILTFASVLRRDGVREGGGHMDDKRPVKFCAATTIAQAFQWFVTDSVRNLSCKGFDVTVMCGETDDEFVRKHSEFSKVEPIPMRRGASISNAIVSIRAIGRVFRRENFDMIQYSTPNAALFCTLARGFKKIPVRAYCQWGIRYVGFSGFKRFVYKRIEKFTCKRATHIISTSPKNMEFAISQGLCSAEKISIIGRGGTIGVDLGVYDITNKPQDRIDVRRELGIDEATFVFGYFGRLNADKGIAELLRAYRALIHTTDNCALLLVGMEDSTNSVDSELMQWARDCDSVYLTGGVLPAQVARLMSATDIVVHPTYREGFSMVLQEAQAMALPIITTDVPGPSEVIVNGETGMLVEAHSDKALLDAMVKLMGSPELMKRFSDNGRIRVERHFARPVMLDNIYTRYCSMIKIAAKEHIKYMFLTSDPELAENAEYAGIDRIFLDLEILGKQERQGHLDTVVSHSSLDDVARLRRVIHKADFLVRCNPVHPGLAAEIDRIVADGADIIMLPFFKTAQEVRTFIGCVKGRVRTVLLFETPESVENVDEILDCEGIDEVYIGLNDMHLGYKMDFMFQLLTDGTVDMLCDKFRKKGLPFGFGGIAKIGEGMLRSDDVLGEHRRLGSTCAILSRTFRNEVGSKRDKVDLLKEIALLREREAQISLWTPEQFESNRLAVAQKVDEITQEIRNKKAEQGVLHK